MGKYGAWQVGAGMATLGDLSIPITRDKPGVYARGEYGAFSSERRVAISGVCLFDARWSVEFSTGGVRSIALPLDRSRVQDRIRERGFEVSRVIFPLTLTDYHTKLLHFVANTVEKLQPEKLLFHIPIDEYYVYIQELETLIGGVIPDAQEILAGFAGKVTDCFRAEMQRVKFERFELIRPMQCGAADTEQSYAMPYQQPEVFGTNKEAIYAIEDLVEM